MAILYGTQSNGDTLPVEVNEFGQLVAKGIEGPPGPEGPPGVGELPPGAFDGAVLGWENGELVWFGTPIPPVSSTAFRPVVYSGNDGTQSIDCGFSPDLVWMKVRNDAFWHALYDTVRGPAVDLSSNTTNAETNRPNGLTAFTNDGFTVNGDSNTNREGKNYVAWCWNGGETTVTNNDGTIESQVRSNGDFSVVSYTGNGGVANIGHGLNTKLAMLIVKSLDTEYWYVYHEGLDPNGEGTQYLRLDLSNGVSSSNAFWNSTAPTSSVFTVGPDRGTCGSNQFIAYAWAETASSDFGKYTGISSRLNVVTGFRPSFVMIKSTGSANWFMFDNARGASNALYANLDNEEDNTGAIQFSDIGFELLFGLPGLNESGQTYIYAAFANPEDAAFAQRQLRRQVRQEKRQQNETLLR